MPTESELSSIHARMKQMADELFEHVDCVVMMASVTDDDRGSAKTHTLHVARGNHHTRQGLVYDYLAWTVDQRYEAENEEES